MFPYSVQTQVLGVRSHDMQQVGCVILGASEDNIEDGHFGELLAVNSD